jgi:hypothetical protein
MAEENGTKKVKSRRSITGVGRFEPKVNPNALLCSVTFYCFKDVSSKIIFLKREIGSEFVVFSL